ncbi:MAG: FtsQ-type POTRA domain-containing protein [Candidatus Thioglobus sp.]|jgi:cell division protein FtsQ|nr:FtsQ-type POTRA domain-containing protein [Candidatus Thioglobus sp.]MBT7839358.1 FtsQ-type POTRA domain-containing protein [Candidatus Thioglobus sp.]
MQLKSRNQHRLPLLQQIKRWFKPLIFGLIITAIGWGETQYNPSELLKISINWEIDRPQLVNQKTLEQQIKPLINQSYQLDLHKVKYELEQHPWVQEAQVRRLFWDAIHIDVTTHKVAAHWENIDCKQPFEQEDCQGYITTQGNLIMPENLFYQIDGQTPSDLVLLKSGEHPKQYDSLLKDYRVYQKILSELTILSLTRSNIDRLTIKPNIAVVLGYNKQQQRLQDFIKIYKKLRQKIPLKKLNKATYDMRYPKGFTLKY